MQYTPRKFNFQPRKDPNAMDVDVLTAEEQSDLMRKGACFRCKAQGHLSRDCPNKERKVELKKEEKKKAWKGKDLVAYVWAQMLEISEEEKGEFYAAVAKPGFLIKRAVSTSTPLSPPICIQTMFSGAINKNSLTIPLKIKTEEETVETNALLDSGAGGKFIDQNYAKTLNLPLKTLGKPIPAINVDGTLNKKGTIKHYVNLELEIFGQPQTIRLLITGLGKQKILLGFPWLQKNNPIIDWQTGTFQ